MPAMPWSSASAESSGAPTPAAGPTPASARSNPATAPSASASNTPARRNPTGGENDEGLPALMGKGRMLERAGDWDKARELYTAAIQRFPNDPAPHHRLGVVADQQRRYLEAEQHFSEAIRLDPKNAEQFNDLGYCYYLQGQLQRAETAMLKAVQLEPKNARFQNNYGMVLAHQGRIDQALVAFRQAGSEADAQYNLAFVYATQEKVDLAKGCFRRALAADPQHEAARKALQSFEIYDQMPEDQRDFEVASSGVRWVPYREPGEAGSAGAAGSPSAVQPASHFSTTGMQRAARTAAQAQHFEPVGGSAGSQR